MVVSAGCSDDFLLSTSNLEIGPDPAFPGDMVVASVLVSVIPTQRHTIFLIVDGEEHLRVSSAEQPAIPVILQLGDAADLIQRYGTGVRVAHVEVRLDDSGRSARSQSAGFELQESEP